MSNILIISQRLPYPTDRGDKLRVYNIAKELAKTNTLYLLVFKDEIYANYEDSMEIKNIFKRVITIKKSKLSQYLDMIIAIIENKPLQVAKYKSNKMNNVALEIIDNNEISIVYGFHIRSLPVLLNIKKNRNKVKVICDLTDCMGLYISRMKMNTKSIFLKFILTIEKVRIEKYEKSAIWELDELWIISKNDLSYHEEWANNKEKFKIVSNGVNEELENEYIEKHTNRLLFVGYMGVESIESLEWFIERIFPIIKEEIPNVQLDIVGRNAPKAFLKKIRNIKGIEYLGYVDSLKKVYETAEVSIAPMKFVAGQQNKILESMLSSVPVVATSYANDGIEAIDQKNIIIADDEIKFANEIISLLKNREKRKYIAENAKIFVKKEYSWKNIPKVE